MLQERLRDEWLMRKAAAPIHPTMTFTAEGLVFGAGTILVAANEGWGTGLRGEEARVLSLLSAAQGRAVARSALRNIERAVKCWCEGDACLAYIHLAHAGLRVDDDPRAAACRIFLADKAMKGGVSPRAILQALEGSHGASVAKFYNPQQPRVPAGSGRTSGQWTRFLSWIASLDAAQIAELGSFASRLLAPAGAATAAFGLLFIPSPNNLRVEGDVPEIRGLRYAWNRDETSLHLTYDSADGNRHTFSAQYDGEVFRDVQGRVIGRVLSNKTVVIDANAVSPDLVDDDKPKLCPVPTKDRRTTDKGLDYENYIKSMVNPQNPTPPYMGYNLGGGGEGRVFDDCQHSTGTMVEIKDGYAEFLESDWGRGFLKKYFMDQAEAQVRAAGTRPIRWYFSDESVRKFAKEIFTGELAKIETIFVPRRGER